MPLRSMTGFGRFQQDDGTYAASQWIHWNGETYYIDTVPISFNVLFYFLINIGTLLASILMLVGPSYMITKINPANSMRYE